MKEEKKSSVLKTLLLNAGATLLNIQFITASLILLAFNDTSTTFSLWEGFLFALMLMLFPLFLCLPIYAIGFFVGRSFFDFFHRKTYLIFVSVFFLTIFLFYWYVAVFVYI